MNAGIAEPLRSSMESREDVRRCPARCPECDEGWCIYDRYHEGGHRCDDPRCGYVEGERGGFSGSGAVSGVEMAVDPA